MTTSPGHARAAAIVRLHRSRAMLALAITGGGSGAISALLSVAGASRTLIEAQVPYAPGALRAYLGTDSDTACTPDTAEAMARTALARALTLRPDATVPIVGVGATAALVSDRPKRGDHRAHIATFDGFRVAALTVRLAKGRRSRAREEALVTDAVLSMLGAAFGIDQPALPMAAEGDHIETSERSVADPVDSVIRGEQPWIAVRADGRTFPGAEGPAAIVPGSFDPLHAGHRALRAAAATRVDGSVAYEVSVTNVDKPPLAAAAVASRREQFAGEAPLLVTSAPTFVEKARLFPGTVFAIGADTAARVVDPGYYGGEARMRAALSELRESGARFLVAGRHDGSRFIALGEVAMPDEAADLFDEIPADEMRVDVSSTALRQGGRQPAT